MIPQLLQDGLDRYVKRGIACGDFLTAVLENNLMEAFGRADDLNRINLFNICKYVYNEMPGACHGSPAKVREWLNKFKTEGRN